MAVLAAYSVLTRTPLVEAPSRGCTGCYLFTVSNSGLLSVQSQPVDHALVQRQPVDHAYRHRHIPELTCGFNSSVDKAVLANSYFMGGSKIWEGGFIKKSRDGWKSPTEVQGQNPGRMSGDIL